MGAPDPEVRAVCASTHPNTPENHQTPKRSGPLPRRAPHPGVWLGALPRAAALPGRGPGGGAVPHVARRDGHRGRRRALLVPVGERRRPVVVYHGMLPLCTRTKPLPFTTLTPITTKLHIKPHKTGHGLLRRLGRHRQARHRRRRGRQRRQQPPGRRRGDGNGELYRPQWKWGWGLRWPGVEWDAGDGEPRVFGPAAAGGEGPVGEGGGGERVDGFVFDVWCGSSWWKLHTTPMPPPPSPEKKHTHYR